MDACWYGEFWLESWNLCWSLLYGGTGVELDLDGIVYCISENPTTFFLKYKKLKAALELQNRSVRFELFNLPIF